MTSRAGRGRRAQVLAVQREAYAAASFSPSADSPDGFGDSVFVRPFLGGSHIVHDSLTARDVGWSAPMVAVVIDAVESPFYEVSKDELGRRYTVSWLLPPTKRFGRLDKELTHLSVSGDPTAEVGAHVRRVLELGDPWWASTQDLPGALRRLREQTPDLAQASPDAVAHRVVAEAVSGHPDEAVALLRRWREADPDDDWLVPLWANAADAALARLT